MKSDKLFRRIIINAIVLSLIYLIALFIFTNNIMYCIIAMTGSILAIFGFFIMIKTFDDFIFKKKKNILILVSISKLIFVTIIYYFLSKYSINEVITFTIGFLTIVGAIMVEGIYQVYTGLINGRT